MKVRDFIADKRLNPDAQLVFSKIMVLDEEDELVAVVDLPVVGVATNEDDNEVRFCIKAQGNVKEDLLRYFGEFKIYFVENGEEHDGTTETKS